MVPIDVVDEGDDAARREPEVEAERDVRHDEDDRDGDALHGAVAELRARPRPDPLGAQRVVGRASAPSARLSPSIELVALAHELDLDLVVARVLDQRVRCRRVEARCPLPSPCARLIQREIRRLAETRRDLVAARAELDLGRSLRFGALGRATDWRRKQSARSTPVRVASDEGRDLVDADQVAMRVLGVVHLDDVGPAEAGRLDRAADLAAASTGALNATSTSVPPLKSVPRRGIAEQKQRQRSRP